MSESRVKIDIRIPDAILNSYLKNRGRIWNSYWGVLNAKNMIRDDQGIRTSECESLKKQFSLKPDLKNRWDIIMTCADLAKKAQAETSATHSDYALALHAVRTFYIRKTLNSELREPFLRKVSELKQQYVDLKTEMNQKIDQGICVDALITQSDELFRKLIMLHDPETLKTAILFRMFDGIKPWMFGIKPTPAELAKIPHHPDLKININFPLILHNEYYIFYLMLVIKASKKRSEEFINALQTSTTENQHPHYEEDIDEINDFLKLDPENNAVAKVSMLLSSENPPGEEEAGPSHSESSFEIVRLEDNDFSPTPTSNQTTFSASLPPPSAEPSALAQQGFFSESPTLSRNETTARVEQLQVLSGPNLTS